VSLAELRHRCCYLAMGRFTVQDAGGSQVSSADQSKSDPDCPSHQPRADVPQSTKYSPPGLDLTVWQVPGYKDQPASADWRQLRPVVQVQLLSVLNGTFFFWPSNQLNITSPKLILPQSTNYHSPPPTC